MKNQLVVQEYYYNCVYVNFVFKFIETKDIRKIIEQMLHKKPENRIASSDVVNLLINTREIRTKKVITSCFTIT